MDEIGKYQNLCEKTWFKFIWTLTNFQFSAKDKKIVDITAPHAPNTTAQDDDQVQSEGEEDEQVAAALRLRMFLSTEDSTEEDEVSEEATVADEEIGKGRPDGHRFWVVFLIAFWIFKQYSRSEMCIKSHFHYQKTSSK